MRLRVCDFVHRKRVSPRDGFTHQWLKWHRTVVRSPTGLVLNHISAAVAWDSSIVSIRQSDPPSSWG